MKKQKMVEEGIASEAVSQAWQRARNSYVNQEQRINELLNLLKDDSLARKRLIRWAIRERAGDKGTALLLIDGLAPDEKFDFALDLLWLGTTERWHYASWPVIATLPRDWLGSHFDTLIDQLLETEDVQWHVMAYSLLFNGFAQIDDDLKMRLVNKALASEDKDIVAEAKHWL